MTQTPFTAADIARALKARRSGGGWMACCIAHQDREPSLSISEGKDGIPLFHCHAGCSQDQVLNALRKRGLWHDGAPIKSRVFAALKKKNHAMSSELTDKEKAAIENCTGAWEEAVPAEGTRAQLYLQTRGIISHVTPLPAALRYVEHRDALIAAVTTNDGKMVGLHCIFLVDDEAGVTKKNKLSFGPIRFGAIHLSAPDIKMQVCESVEDALALQQMNGVATLAVPGTSLFGRVIPPKPCHTVILAPDRDEAGEKAIAAASAHLQELGYAIRVLLPPPEAPDWCDFLPLFEERRAIVEEPFHG